ncbi:MAG TPA: hypothetical protein P5211_02095 [Anaerolineae bacterium]|nr:hypothetical protein [Anaerolineae bacterium]
MTLNLFLIAVAALGGGALVALLLSRWIVEGNLGAGEQRSRLSRLLTVTPVPVSSAARLARRVDVKRGLLPDFAQQVRWTQLQGSRLTAEDWLGYSLLAGLVGAAGGAAVGGLAVAEIGLLAFYLPYYVLRGQARGAQQKFHRQLPELLQVLAAEVASGASLSVGLERLTSSVSLAGRLFKQLLADAQAYPGGLWGVNNQPGGLQQAARTWGSPSLYSLTAQLEAIHAQGIEGAETLALLAKSVSLRELGEARRQAENLDHELLMPLSLLFFTPFTAAIIAPVMWSVINAF